MTTLVCIEAALQTDRMRGAVQFLQKRFPETRAYPGCQEQAALKPRGGFALF